MQLYVYNLYKIFSKADMLVHIIKSLLLLINISGETIYIDAPMQCQSSRSLKIYTFSVKTHRIIIPMSIE